ncbi:uncharacterized protein PG998_008265 [Apiospora kogelbergensis]|uniref:Uncharacterized protein n=1 Tax=Apiospora kogelbergensis TaxID=1337665 RepID=A0AAW0QCI9_9PEZI
MFRLWPLFFQSIQVYTKASCPFTKVVSAPGFCKDWLGNASRQGFLEEFEFYFAVSGESGQGQTFTGTVRSPSERSSSTENKEQGEG